MALNEFNKNDTIENIASLRSALLDDYLMALISLNKAYELLREIEDIQHQLESILEI